MILPIEEQVIVAVGDLLASVTEANGYQVTIAAVNRPTGVQRENTWPQHGEAILYAGEREMLEAAPDGSKEWAKSVEVLIGIRPSDLDQTPTDQIAAIWSADVEKALATDEQLTELATDSEVVSVVPVTSPDGGMAGVYLTIRAMYRTLYGNPYQIGG